MRVDFAALFQAVAACLGREGLPDGEAGTLFRKAMRALVPFDDVVIFAYRGGERPIDLYSTFGAEDHEIFVSLYQAGPFLLDPFYHAARAGRSGVFRMRELAPDRFFSSEYYRSYYSQTKLAEEIGFFVANKLAGFSLEGRTELSVNLPAVLAPALQEGHRIGYLHVNVPGFLASVNQLLAGAGANITGQYLATSGEQGYVVTDATEALSEDALAKLSGDEHCVWVRTWSA